MPENTNIFLIRHGEKPDKGTGLSVEGQQRAQAYSIYFQNFMIDSKPVRLDYLFAAADSSESHRSRLTIKPLSIALGLKINDKHSDKHYHRLAEDLIQDPKYNNSNILICWHHGEILELAAALGARVDRLPPESRWPDHHWPPEVFGWLLQIRFDGNGKVDPAQTVCINERLMYDDCGMDPPLSSSSQGLLFPSSQG